MPDSHHDTAVETIVDADLWTAVCDGVNTIASRPEAAFEFDDDGLRVRVREAANVAMIAQTVPADAFDHYTVDGDVTIGLDTDTFADLLGVADGDDPVAFDLNAETRKLEFESRGVEYDLAGINPDAMAGTPTDVPAVDDEYAWTIDVDLPVGLWDRGTDVADLAGSDTGTFVYDPDTGDVVLEGAGDTDASRVVLSDADAFAWRDGPPDDRVECVQSNDYMPSVIDVIDDDVVRFVTGTELPYHVFTERADGRIDTKLLQAPRITSG
jgi:hypothetical protein